MIIKCRACGVSVSNLDKKCRKCGATIKSDQVVQVAGRNIKRTIRPTEVRRTSRRDDRKTHSWH